MRITNGIYKFKKVISNNNIKLRPTSNKVREAVFNILISRYGWNSWCKKANLLDAFSGTGIIALEGFSRNLKKATMIESNYKIFNNLEENINKLELNKRVVLIKANFFEVKLIKKGYNLVYLDPPYFSDFSNLAIKKILDEQALDSSAILISESIRGYNYNKDLIKFICQQKNYGKTLITFFKF